MRIEKIGNNVGHRGPWYGLDCQASHTSFGRAPGSSRFAGAYLSGFAGTFYEVDRTAWPRRYGIVRTIGHYTTDEAARLVGALSPHRLSRWASYGIVPTGGTNPNVYSYADIGEAILAHYLINLGWRPGHVRALVHRLRKEWGLWPLATAPLEHDGKLVVIREGNDLVFDVIDRLSEHARAPGNAQSRT